MGQEGQNKFRIIFGKTIMFKIVNYLEDTERCAVRARSGHGIVYVCDGNDCRIFINIGLRQTGWITTAVTSLVMA